MSIRRCPRRDSFTVIDNRLVNDPALDFAALGALVYLLSKPDNWTVKMDELEARGGIGRHAMRAIMGRVEGAGYATRETLRTDDGRRAAGSAWSVSEVKGAASESPVIRRSENLTVRKPDDQRIRPPENLTARKSPPIVNTESLVMTEDLPKTEDNPQTPAADSAAKPRNRRRPRPGNDTGDDARFNGSAQRARRTRAAVDEPNGGNGGGGRWHPVAAAIMRAIGRPEPRGKLPAWLGNTVRTFGEAAGDDPALALAMVGRWAASNALRQTLAGGYLRDHTLPAVAGAWIASMRQVGGAGGQRVAVRDDAAMRAAGAPDNWRELVFAPGGVRRAPALVLPMLGLAHYAPPADWPAWYRQLEGVNA